MFLVIFLTHWYETYILDTDPQAIHQIARLFHGSIKYLYCNEYSIPDSGIPLNEWIVDESACCSFLGLPWQGVTKWMTQRTEVYRLTVLEAGSLRSGCRQGSSILRDVKEYLSHTSHIISSGLKHSLACRWCSPWVFMLSCLCTYLCIQIFPFCKDTVILD